MNNNLEKLGKAINDFKSILYSEFIEPYIVPILDLLAKRL